MIDRLLGLAGDKLYTLLAFLIVLGVIIFVHEFGHFVTAKFFRMRVFIFSFGFGKRLFGFKRGDTDYRVSLVPLGGYVKLEGEQDDYLSENTAQQGDRKDFLARPRWQRFLVYLAGPAMNAVLTIVVLATFYMIGVYEPSEQGARPIIGAVSAGQPAEKAGLGPGDEVVAIDGRPISRWEELQFQVSLAAGRTLRMSVRREGALREVEVRPIPDGPDRVGKIGAYGLAYVLALRQGWPADKAGLRVDDAILSADEKPIRGMEDLVAATGSSKGAPVVLRVLREGRIFAITAHPEDRGEGFKIGIEDVGPQRILRRLPPIAAVGAALSQTWQMTRQIGDVLARLVTGRLSVRAMAGPLGIAREAGRHARAGKMALFAFIAFVSLNVGLLNLFPLTPLDGGHMLLLAAEGLIRRDISLRVKTWIMNAGAVAILLLIAVVFFFDFAKMGWLGRSLQ